MATAMATQALSVQIPQWPLSLAPSPELPSSLPSRDAIEIAILRLSKMVNLPTPVESPAPSIRSEETMDSEILDYHSNMEALPVDFAPSKLDPVYIPNRDDILRPFFLKIMDEKYYQPVFASDIHSHTFRGFLRTMAADRPFYDPSGPPEWTAEYHAVYEICRRIYVQKFTQDGHSMLYRIRIHDKGEVAGLRVIIESVIGRPSLYQQRTVRIFEEAIPYTETGFSPLPPGRPLCARPPSVAHQCGCLCPKYWPEMISNARDRLSIPWIYPKS
ncbi:hypothetical protein ACEPAH_8339 [Sanghuangporus vaninii]